MTFRQDANQLWAGVKGACFASLLKSTLGWSEFSQILEQFKPEEFATEYQQMER